MSEGFPRLKVMTVLGTRPEIIRLSATIALLDRHADHLLVHTGQNYDYELNGIFFEQMGVRKPDVFMEVDTASLASVMAGVLLRTEALIAEHRPDAMLILGDTNSAIAAIIARRMKVPVYHMEAGNRSFDRNVPEESNRRIVDHTADFNLPYSEHARRNLLAEGLHPRRIVLTGSPLAEVLAQHRESIAASTVLERLGLEEGAYLLASLHREENVDCADRLGQAVSALNAVADHFAMPVVLSTHPRTQQRLARLGGTRLSAAVRALKPFGFFDYCRLQTGAFCTISDSGTIAEESAILGFPAISPRDAIERPEAIESGHIMATGLDTDAMIGAIELVTSQHAHWREAGARPAIPPEYTVTNCAERVVRLILATARLSNHWDGIRQHALA